MAPQLQPDRFFSIIKRLEELEELDRVENEKLQEEANVQASIANNLPVLPPPQNVRPPSMQFLARVLGEEAKEEESPTITHTLSKNPSSSPELESADSTPTTKQIFFDCDNTLVNTEALAVEAAATVVNKCLADHGIDDKYTVEELVGLYFGFTARKMLGPIARGQGLELAPAQLAQYATYEEDLVIELIHERAQPCAGIERVLEELYAAGEYKLAVVSSSPIRRIRAALESAGIAKYFAHDQVFSAKSSMPTPKSKPDPAIYQYAMENNKLHPWECIAIEDSRSGAQSATRAGIPCIAYVGAYATPGQREQVGQTLAAEGCKAIVHKYTQFLGVFETVKSNVERELNQHKLRAPPKSKEELWLDFEIWLREMLHGDEELRKRLWKFMQQPHR